MIELADQKIDWKKVTAWFIIFSTCVLIWIFLGKTVYDWMFG